MGHARLSPSSAHRWMRCAAAPAFTDGREGNASQAAIDGTLAHEWVAWRLSEPACDTSDMHWPAVHDAWEKREPKISDDWREPLMSYVEYAQDLAAGSDWWAPEQRVGIGKWTHEKGATGTADFLVLKGRTLHVLDLKFGVGDLVRSEYVGEKETGGINPQTGLYGLGAVEDLDFLGDVDTVVLHIHQPRREHVDVLEVPLQRLRDFGMLVSAAASLTFANDAEFTPSSRACQWCPGRGACEARASALVVEMRNAANTISNGDLAALLQKADDLRGFLEDVEMEAFKRVREGSAVGDYKIVEANTKRRYGDNARIVLVEKLGDGALRPPLPRELLTLGDAAKALKDKFGSKAEADKVMATITVKPRGAPVLAPGSDPRPVLPLTASDMFKPE